MELVHSNSFLNGDWNIVTLEYETQIDIPILGSQTISGNATNAGFGLFNIPNTLVQTP